MRQLEQPHGLNIDRELWADSANCPAKNMATSSTFVTAVTTLIVGVVMLCLIAGGGDASVKKKEVRY